MWPAVDLPHRQRAFTLLEITIVIFLILLLLGIALPSISGQLSRQRLQKTLDSFDALVATAQRQSVAEKRPYSLAWTRDGVVQVYPADLAADERKKREPTAALVPAGPTTARDEHYTLVRAASLTSQPAEVWTFWPTGNCEPVSVRYQGPAGRWEAVYNPLSAKPDLKTFLAR